LQNVTPIGKISLLPAEYDFHWQKMIYTGLLSLLLAEYAASQKRSAVLLCSADSIYPHSLRVLCLALASRSFTVVDGELLILGKAATPRHASHLVSS